ncbi:MAG: VanZ family protein [Pirellulaceae bacterium]
MDVGCSLRGPWGLSVAKTLAGAVLAAYLVVALYPFRWNPPQRRLNGAAVTEQGHAIFSEPGAVWSASPPAWVRSAIDADAFAIELRVRSPREDQTGPARIFTVSESPHARNVTIGQQFRDLVVRLRSSVTSENGIPEITVSNVYRANQWTDIAVRLESGRLSIQVDGQERVTQDLPSPVIANWPDDYHLVLGNEWTFDRPWQGEIAAAHVSVGDRRWNCLAPSMVVAPRQYWHGLKFQYCTPADQERTSDLILNLVCFMPAGFLLAWGMQRWLWPVLVCAGVSLCVEFTQLFIDTRMPSLSDWACNSVGALLGAVLLVGMARIFADQPRRDDDYGTA